MLYRDYRKIEGYEDYIISNYGEVFSLKGKKPRILKPTLSNTYRTVGLCKDNKKITHSVHALVGNAFVGKRENELTFDHIDRVRTNNRADNLRLATRSEQTVNQKLNVRNTTGERNISIKQMGDNTYYYIELHRNGKHVVHKNLNIKKYTLEDAIKFRDVQMEKLKSNTNENEID